MTAPLKPPRLRLPRTVRAGDVIEIRTLAEHPMETGIRADGSAPPPRDMLRRIEISMNGALLFAADLRNRTAANPYHVFFARVTRTSDFTVTLIDEGGQRVSAGGQVLVS